MTISELLTRACTVIHRSKSGETDEYGNEQPTETPQETVCEVQEQQRTEPETEGELSDTRWAGFFPAGTELDTGDAVEVPGLGVFEVIGAPWSVRDPEEQALSHVEATLRRTAGATEDEEVGS